MSTEQTPIDKVIAAGNAMAELMKELDLRTSVANWDEALAELDKAQQPSECDGSPMAREREEGDIWNSGASTHKAQQPGKVLTDDVLDNAAKAWSQNLPGAWDEEIDWASIAENVLRYARDNGYLTPAAGLTVEEIIEVVQHHEEWIDKHTGVNGIGQECAPSFEECNSHLKACLTAAINAKKEGSQSLKPNEHTKTHEC